MSHFSRKVLFFAAVAVTFSSQLKPAEALRCFQCAGYDRVENQCNPEVEDGKSIECTGPHPVCELIVETYSGDSVLNGNFYYLRKCGQQPDLDNNVTVSTCAPEVPIASTLVTRCYCNTKDDCNRGLVNGKGSKNEVIRAAFDPNDWEFLSAKETTDSANEVDPSSPLKCWQCSGYNKKKNECAR
ncbi:hypothetical protein Ocin01_17215 [Orchesella cincta]|uniref:Protein quiver n=1 Tax=Orchesella cincta TaxID=48709 RepID=A0A1D2M920_ORCCI|nr:hypothetical protein Ocin01_17215 [Orchesella cincta]